MVHRDWSNRVLAYHEGGLSREERGRTEAHLKDCTRCRELLARVQETDALLRASRPTAETLPPAVSSAILAEALARARRPGMGRTWAFGPFAVSLGCLLLVSTAAIHRQPRGARAAPGPSLAAEVRPAPDAEASARTEPAAPKNRAAPSRRLGQRHPTRFRLAAREAPRVAAREPQVVTPRVETASAVPAAGSPQGELLLVVNEAPRLEVEVRELPEDAPGQACASSAVQDSSGRVTQKEVTVSSLEPEPQVVLRGEGGEPDPAN